MGNRWNINMDGNLKILNRELIRKIDLYLDSFEYGEVVIKKHQHRITIDVFYRNRQEKVNLKTFDK